MGAVNAFSKYCQRSGDVDPGVAEGAVVESNRLHPHRIVASSISALNP